MGVGNRPGKRFGPYIDWFNALVRPTKFYPLDDSDVIEGGSGYPRAHSMHGPYSGQYEGSEAGDFNVPSIVMGTYGHSAHNFSGGSDEHVSLYANQTDGAETLTILLWFRPDVNQQHVVFGGGPSHPDYTLMYLRSGGTMYLDCVIGDGSSTGGSTNDGDAPSVGEVACIAWTWDGSNIRRYLDGKPTGTVDAWAGGPISTGSARDQIASRPSSATDDSHGYMAMFYLGVDDVLTEAEIRAINRQGRTRHQPLRRPRSML